MTRALTFGTAPAPPTHIQVRDDHCSPQHCRITHYDATGFWIEDLGSTNGTHIRRAGTNIQAQGPMRLLSGDTIHIGRTRLPWAVR